MATTFAFDGTNPAAQRAANQVAGRLISGITEETRAAIRDLIVRSIREGIPPYDAARLIRSLVGLNDRQVRAVVNYRLSLIESGLSLEAVNAKVDRYAERKLAERAEAIARTETMRALNEGVQQSGEQAQRDDLLGDGAQKEWMIAPDERLCPLCSSMDGQRVPMDQDFDTPVGPLSGPPMHPNCRCVLAVVP